jgi:plastocyanin
MVPSSVVLLLAIVALLAAAGAQAATIDVQVLDAAGNPVADAVVFAAPSSGPVEAKAAKTVAVEQSDREFVPYVSAIQTGTPVAFPNRDAILHHVYSFSPAKSFEIKLYKGKSPGEVRFDKPGIVTLGCNIHDWMIAYILVVSTPHFATTGADGLVRLKDVPTGAYELKAWHPQLRAAPAGSPVTVEGAAQYRTTFVVDLVPRKPRYKPPLDRLKY